MTMTKKEKEEKRVNFLDWVTFIEDRVNQWKKHLPRELSEKLDWSIDSFSTLERFVLENYTIEQFRDPANKDAVDALASYIGETYRLNLPNAKWEIELDEESDINFNAPAVTTVPPAGVPINPFPLVFRIINNKSGDILKRIFEGTVAIYNELKK
jgi:hypothetical protein